MSKQIQVGKLVRPGEVIASLDANLTPGNGVMIQEGKFVSALRGYVKLSDADTSNCQTLSVSKGQDQSLGINIDDEVLARVTKIKEETIFLNVVCVNGKPIAVELEAVIKRADIREKDIDHIVAEECFIPGDIVKAVVASYGDSRRIQLKTHNIEHGVVFAKSQTSGHLMFPIGPEEMICPISEVKERRKVAVPNFEEFQGVQKGKMQIE